MRLIHKIETTLVQKLRAWYWHFEVERLALEHFYSDAMMPLEIWLKARCCTLVVKTIRFFVWDDDLLLEPPDAENGPPTADR